MDQDTHSLQRINLSLQRCFPVNDGLLQSGDICNQFAKLSEIATKNGKTDVLGPPNTCIWGDIFDRFGVYYRPYTVGIHGAIVAAAIAPTVAATITPCIRPIRKR